MVGNERAYNFHQLVNMTNSMNRLAAVEFEKNELKFRKVHKKMDIV